MSQLPIIGEGKTDDKRVLRLDIYVLSQGPTVDFYWNEIWAATVNPAWPQQVFLAALQALWAAGLTVLGNVQIPGMKVRNEPKVN